MSAWKEPVSNRNVYEELETEELIAVRERAIARHGDLCPTCGSPDGLLEVQDAPREGDVQIKGIWYSRCWQCNGGKSDD